MSAHMLAAGLRARNASGAHAAVALYAAEVIGTTPAHELDRMRRFRNRIEYGTASFTAGQVAHDLEHARGIVADVARALAR